MRKAVAPGRLQNHSMRLTVAESYVSTKLHRREAYDPFDEVLLFAALRLRIPPTNVPLTTRNNWSTKSEETARLSIDSC